MGELNVSAQEMNTVSLVHDSNRCKKRNKKREGTSLLSSNVIYARLPHTDRSNISINVIWADILFSKWVSVSSFTPGIH